MDWIRSAREDLASCVAALRLSWAPDDARGRLMDEDEQWAVVSDWMLRPARRVPFRWVALGMVAALVLSACSRVDPARWTEEVKSWDGHVFQLEGYAEQDKSGRPLSHRGTTRFIEYYHPASGAYWKQEYGYQPAVFDFVGGKAIVLLEANTAGMCFLQGYPPLALLALRWTGTGWEQFSVDGLPIEKMRFNVLRQIFDRKDSAKDAHGLVSLIEKRRRDPGEILLRVWIDEWGQSCVKAKEQGLGVDGLVPPVLTGSHGSPQRFAK